MRPAGLACIRVQRLSVLSVVSGCRLFISSGLCADLELTREDFSRRGRVLRVLLQNTQD